MSYKYNAFTGNFDYFETLSSFDGGSASDNVNFLLDGGLYNTTNILEIDAGDSEESGLFLVDGGEL